LGASELLGALSTDSKALDEERWGGAIDVVGGRGSVIDIHGWNADLLIGKKQNYAK